MYGVQCRTTPWDSTLKYFYCTVHTLIFTIVSFQAYFYLFKYFFQQVILAIFRGLSFVSQNFSCPKEGWSKICSRAIFVQFISHYADHISGHATVCTSYMEALQLV